MVLFNRLFKDKEYTIKGISLSEIVYVSLSLLLFSFSYFQFNYVVMPYDFFIGDAFPIGYEYKGLKDDVRIEYFARNYYEYGEVYRHSYDKDEIKTFLNFFEEIETTMDYELLGSPDVWMDWDDDIHVMIRNMDEDNDGGYYVFSINLVDSSTYSLKISGGGVTVIYEVPEELKEFIVEHLLLDE